MTYAMFSAFAATSPSRSTISVRSPIFFRYHYRVWHGLCNFRSGLGILQRLRLGQWFKSGTGTGQALWIYRKTVIHPNQIPLVNDAYRVSKEDYEDAKAILHWEKTAPSLVHGNVKKPAWTNVRHILTGQCRYWCWERLSELSTANLLHSDVVPKNTYTKEVIYIWKQQQEQEKMSK